MHRYVIKRLLMMIPVIIGVSFLVFLSWIWRREMP